MGITKYIIIALLVVIIGLITWGGIREIQFRGSKNEIKKLEQEKLLQEEIIKSKAEQIEDLYTIQKYQENSYNKFVADFDFIDGLDKDALLGVLNEESTN